MVLDEGDDLRLVLVGEAQAVEHHLGDADADLDVAVEADAVGAVSRGAEGGWLADVVQQRAPSQRGRTPGLELLEHQHGVRPHVALGVELRRLADAMQPDGLGQHLGEQAGGVQKLEGIAGVALGEHLRDLVADALGGDLMDVRCKGLNGREGGRFDLVAKPSREAHSPQHAELVLGEAQVGLADGADGLCGEVGAASDEVEHGGREVAGCGVGQRVEQHAVDGEVPAPHILLGRGGEVDGIGPPSVAVRSVVAEGGDLGDALAAVALRAHENDAEVRADGVGLREERLDDIRRRGGGHVDVLGREAEQQVAHGAAGEVGLMARLAEPPRDGKCCVELRCVLGHAGVVRALWPEPVWSSRV